MEFKIDTKDTFTVIAPVIESINAKLAVELQEICEKARQSGSHNFVIDLQHCTELETDALPGLLSLHEDTYSREQSIVFTGIATNILNELKKHEADLLLNVAPQMAEAVDIISMEILERDLLSEE
jgi:anti-anti-sigma regulatory factor